MASRDIYTTADEDESIATTTDECPECAGALRTVSGETHCTKCGLIISEDHIDHGPEWRSFEGETTDRKRTGAPRTVARHDNGLSTTIGRVQDGSGNPLSWKKRRQLGRLRREHERAKRSSKRERNQVHGLVEIRRMTSALGLSNSLRDQASMVFKSAQKEDLLRGRSIEAIATGSIYAVCRMNGLPRTLDEVVRVARCEYSAAKNGYRVLNRELGIPSVPPRPGDFVGRLASDLGLSNRIRRRAQELVDLAEETGISNGVNPAGVAGACLYIAAHEHGRLIQQAAVAAAADVSTATIRDRRADITEVL
ncbi:transcription initiation factor IIB family protein [Halobacteriaceae archaeon GCM10025711]